jgi:hypothetical protein
MIKLLDILNEVGGSQQEQSKYDGWEKGIIMAWGHVLYLAFHDTPSRIEKIVSEKETRDMFLRYFNESKNDEDMQDWMGENPPTMNRGYALYDKNRLSNMMSNMANKTKLTKPLRVYRTSSDDSQEGWNSYTTNEGGEYSLGTQVGSDSKQEQYELPIGYPVIFADGIADENEVILNLSQNDKMKYQL